MEKIDKHLIIRDGDLNCVLHINPELEIICVEKGSILVKYDDGEIEVGEKQAAVVFPYRLHGVKMQEEAKAFVLMFSQSVAGDFYDNYKAMNMKKYVFDLPDELWTYMMTSIENVCEKMTVYNVKSLYYPLISEYLKGNEATVSKNNISSTLIGKVAEYVSENFKEEITIEDAAEAIGENRTKLNAVLKERAGVGFNDFLNIVRVQKARQIVEFTNQPMTEIAYYCGFGSVRNFNRVFAEVFGCSPSKLRKEKNA